MVSSSFKKNLAIVSLCGCVTGFSSTLILPQHKSSRYNLHSTNPYFTDGEYDDRSSSTYFNSPTSASDELRWGRIVNSRFAQQRDSVTSTRTQSSKIEKEPSRLEQTLEVAKQAFRDSREIEAYNQIHDLEKGSRRMDGPTRSRLANTQPIKSIDDVKDRYPLPRHTQESMRQQSNNFVMQYSEGETFDIDKSFGGLVDGNLVDYAVIRAAAIAGKQTGLIVGGIDPENWID